MGPFELNLIINAITGINHHPKSIKNSTENEKSKNRLSILFPHRSCGNDLKFITGSRPMVLILILLDA